MSATIVSFAQFQDSRQRRQAAGRGSTVPPPVLPEDDAPDDRPLTITCEVPAPAPHDPLPQRP